MPEMDGFETAELIMGNNDTKNIPIIFITALDRDQKYISKGYENGAVDYLFKPIDPIILNSKVDVFLQLYYQRKEIEDLLKIQEEISNNLLETSKVLQEANIELDKTSRTDHLTGLSNRRNITEKIEYEVKRYKRNQNIFSIILGDIDYFKKINDTYGHDCGDFVLIELSKLLTKTIREHDVACRWGGEEFLIFLPETDIKEAIKIAERLRESIESTTLIYNNHKINITMSFGVSGYGNNIEFTECVKNADGCLYNAKQQGRNRVVHEQ